MNHGVRNKASVYRSAVMMVSVAQVEQDGSFKFVDLSNRGGRTFFGLGSLLTGYKVNKKAVLSQR